MYRETRNDSDFVSLVSGICSNLCNRVRKIGFVGIVRTKIGCDEFTRTEVAAEKEGKERRGGKEEVEAEEREERMDG